MDSNTTSTIRDIFLMLAAGVFSALCIVLILLAWKLYRPLRDTAINTARTTENLGRITGDISAVSKETANNVAQTARNAVEVTENLKGSTSQLPDAIQSVGQAARGVASASTTVGRIGRFVGRFTPEQAESQPSSTGSSALSRIIRGLMGEQRSRNRDTNGGQSDA